MSIYPPSIVFVCERRKGEKKRKEAGATRLNPPFLLFLLSYIASDLLQVLHPTSLPHEEARDSSTPTSRANDRLFRNIFKATVNAQNSLSAVSVALHFRHEPPHHPLSLPLSHPLSLLTYHQPSPPNTPFESTTEQQRKIGNQGEFERMEVAASMLLGSGYLQQKEEERERDGRAREVARELEESFFPSFLRVELVLRG